VRDSARAGPIRVLAVDHTAGVAPFRRKFAAIAAQAGIELTVFAPDRWIENYATIRLDARRPIQTDGYSLRSGAVVWPGYENRGFFITGLSEAIRRVRPDILHLWEEPFSLIALQALWFRRLFAPRARAIFFSSDNLSRDFHYAYRPSWFYAGVERYVHRHCAAATAVSQEVEEVLRAKGYSGPTVADGAGLDLADDDDVVAGRVTRVHAALEVRERADEDRHIELPALEREAAEPVGIPRRERPRRLLLPGREDVDREVLRRLQRLVHRRGLVDADEDQRRVERQGRE